ncbi:hypothetical protein ACPXCG_21585 [Gordonia sp. DT218]|uniref:hypothetical protein n=1 Tax=Gordonia sp. DT218 TaxID=3416659 RepID=UPI003CE76C87
MTDSTNEEFTGTHPLGGKDRVPRLGYGAMQLAGPGVIGLPDDVTGAIEILRQAVDKGYGSSTPQTPTVLVRSISSSDGH